MTAGEERSPLRIGNAERTAALKALDEHLAAGRLDVDEYADRSAAAAGAVVAADLADLFTDLPEPHPPLPGGPAAPPPTAPLPVAPPAGEVAPPQPGTLERWAPQLMGVAVVVAIGLFLLTRQGVLMLLIPLAAVLLWAGRRQ
ncbi:DUF1707 SHOCT-like domain-containing protein [Pseudonocardia kunmingensis]|uniref:Uncharacterized protein DUF1707 n=1 Tax=Pseudonocardia kunmingensis TaxID=630975 RepID=A0A543E0L4_9PSEU|nr:DUF1707 domain-containing protein [Pseudonocardia kunmingensis]TQM15125.1 uncharacterized protein DUF1707 [Pseudonocardia kunmingensis]